MDNEGIGYDWLAHEKQQREQAAITHRFCDCEHASHFAEDGEKQHHPYGAATPVEDLALVRHIYGNDLICKACRKDHPVPAHLLRVT